MSDTYTVKPLHAPLNHVLSVPGSKSITNRALLLASMADGESTLTNVLFSDDSRSFMDCLDKLGYTMTVDEPGRTVVLRGVCYTPDGVHGVNSVQDIQGKRSMHDLRTMSVAYAGSNGDAKGVGSLRTKAAINVRSAGTSARFLTALLAAREGEYFIDASAQMKKRPMKPLLEVLSRLGCEIAFAEQAGCLPFTLRGGKLTGGHVTLDTAISSQFLSALLMTGCLHANDLYIEPTGPETARSYVDITLTMMNQFGGAAERRPDGVYVVRAGQGYAARRYAIEPDVSGACYCYAAAALTGGTVTVRDVYLSSMQGDIRFLRVLEEMGCVLTETSEGVRLAGPKNGALRGVSVDLNDCSDQTMTLAVLAVFADSPTAIRHIGHIRHQESDRISAVAAELTKMGIRCVAQADSLVIYPGKPNPAIIDTYDDHRMAMAFTLAGLRTEGIVITNPGCVAKTFENYFDMIDSLY